MDSPPLHSHCGATRSTVHFTRKVFSCSCYRISSVARLTNVILFLSASLLAAQPVVEVEEVVATCRPPNNGAGPLWCYGAPLLVRQGDVVYASVMETGEGVPPLSNTRWRLFRRDDRGWKLVRTARRLPPSRALPAGGDRAGDDPALGEPLHRAAGHPVRPVRPHLLRFDTRRIERRSGRRPAPLAEDGCTSPTTRTGASPPTRGAARCSC